MKPSVKRSFRGLLLGGTCPQWAWHLVFIFWFTIWYAGNLDLAGGFWLSHVLKVSLVESGGQFYLPQMLVVGFGRKLGSSLHGLSSSGRLVWASCLRAWGGKTSSTPGSQAAELCWSKQFTRLSPDSRSLPLPPPRSLLDKQQVQITKGHTGMGGIPAAIFVKSLSVLEGRGEKVRSGGRGWESHFTGQSCNLGEIIDLFKPVSSSLENNASLS